MKKAAAAFGVLALLGFVAWMSGVQLPARSQASPAVVTVSLPATATMTAQEHSYVGAKDGCRKCHLREYRSWSDTPHAGALAVLEEKGEASNPECLRCHTTGYGTDSGFTSADDTPELANVTCEACHGPGSEYRDRDVMKDHDAALAAGLTLPTEETCVRCHNEDSPTFPGTFDFEEMKAKGVHEIRR